jgi:hypothetical protein
MYPVAITGRPVILRELTGWTRPGGTRSVYSKAAMNSSATDPRTEYMLAVADKDEELIGAARLATGEYESATIVQPAE